MSGDDWTTIKSKRSGSVKKKQPLLHIGEQNKVHRSSQLLDALKKDDVDDSKIEDVISKCFKSSLAIEKTSFFEGVIKELRLVSLQCETIISLGIGKICSSPSSLLQLAMVISIQKELSASEEILESFSAIAIDSSPSSASEVYNHDGNIKTAVASIKSKYDFKVNIFDPLFSDKECEVCRSLGFMVSDANLKGKHPSLETMTLFFMPHCPYRLYVNLLWANWDNLENVVILGNRYFQTRKISWCLHKSNFDFSFDY
jgi:hypothetical protein